ncbi:MAG: hypothetical protein JWN00_1254 [Actinomycetia bacterium]|nr:hypothetical protein [Actinomycetes bacterium]
MMGKVTLRNLAAHKLRLALTAIAVVLGVAFVAGTLILTDSMSKSFDNLVSKSGQGVAVDVRGKKVLDSAAGPAPLPASVLTAVAKVDGVRDPVGHVEGYAAVIGKDGKVIATQGPPQIGASWHTGDSFTITSGRAPAGPGEVVVDEHTVKKTGYSVGDTMRIALRGPTQTVRLVGIVSAGNLLGATFTAFDTPTAQRLLLKPGYYTEITMGSTGVGETVLRDRVAQALPGTAEAITGTKMRADAKSQVANALSFFRIFLLVFALISIFVGAFIIFNTFSMLVAQRTRELALLRAVGASRRQVTGAVIGEAVAVGILGSTIGLGLGVGLAQLLQALIFSGSDTSAPLAFTATPVLWAYTVGIVVTVLSAYFPARRAAKIPPVAAMRDDVSLPQRSLRIRVCVGGAFTAGGAIAMGSGIAGATSQPLALLGGGAAAVFLGIAMLAPVISTPVVRVLGGLFPKVFGTPGRLAQQNAMRNPRRTAATAAALMIGLALVTTVNVMSASMSASISKSVDKEFGADYFITQDQGTFSPAAVEEVRRTSGVSKATLVYSDFLKLDGRRTSYTAGDPAALAVAVKAQVTSGRFDTGTDGVALSEDVATSRKLAVGSVVQALYPDGSQQTLHVVGTYTPNDYLGPAVIPEALYQAHTLTPGAVGIAVNVTKAGTATKNALTGALRSDYPNLKVQDESDLKAQAQSQINGLVMMLTALLAMSIIIAAVGVVNTLALSVIERTREIGLLRAVGTSRRQLRRMIRLESIVIAVFGAVLGITLGVSFGAAIQHGLKDQGLAVLQIPVGTLALYVVLAGVIGVVAALWPAWRAGRMDVLKAIAGQ